MEKLNMTEVASAEPIVKPKPKREEKPKPRRGDPWTVPAPYPKHYPQPTPKALENTWYLN